MRIDAHQHFWDLSRGRNDWIDDGLWQIRRDYRPEHLAPYLDHLKIDRTVLVEASGEPSENDFMAAEAASADFVGAIVGWVNLWTADADTIRNLAARPKFHGLRPAIDQSPANAPTLDTRFVEGASQMAELDLSFDAMAVPHLIPFFTKLADACPDLKIVLDHCGKPEIAGGHDAGESWRDDISALSARPNTFCKLSGISREQGQGWSSDGLRGVTDHILDRFTPARTMWGSDWPVLELTSSYTQWVDAVEQLTEGCTSTECAEIMGGTAARFYRI